MLEEQVVGHIVVAVLVGCGAEVRMLLGWKYDG
jgi:hypothetical protein